METHDHLDEWVNRHLAASAPPPEWPDAATAWRHLDQRIAKRTRPVLFWAVATASLCAAAVLVFPGSRAAAQQFWDRIVLGRIQVLVADYDAAAPGFLTPEFQQRPDPQPVPSLEDAARVAGFAPHLPGHDVFAAAPKYSVADVVSATIRLRTPAIRYLVAEAGGSAGDVPSAWDGVVLDVRVGPIVVADYDGVLLLQSRPFQLIKPAGFDLGLFYRLAFRSLGLSERDARALSVDAGMSPALLTFMPKEDRHLLHEFGTKSGTGMMIDEVYGAGKTVALWSSADRVYALYLPTQDNTTAFVTAVADALE